MSEADANLERSITIHQDIKNMLSLYCMLCDEKASTVQTTLDTFFLQRNKTLIFNMSNVLNYSLINN